VAHARRVHAVQQVEEGVHDERRREDLEVDLGPQRVGDELQQLHAALGRVPLLLAQGVPRVEHHSGGQLAGDACVGEVVVEGGELRGALAGDDTQLRHRGGERADEARGDHEAEDEYQDGEDALTQALGRHQMLAQE